MRVLVCVSRRVRAAESPRCAAPSAWRARAVAASIATLILLHIKNGMLFAGRAPAAAARPGGGAGGRRPAPAAAPRAPGPAAGPARAPGRPGPINRTLRSVGD